MPSSARANAKVRSWVIVSTSVFLTVQVLAFLATIAFYLLASSLQYRDEIAKLVLTAFYPPHERPWLRRERAIEVKSTLITT